MLDYFFLVGLSAGALLVDDVVVVVLGESVLDVCVEVVPDVEEVPLDVEVVPLEEVDVPVVEVPDVDVVVVPLEEDDVLVVEAPDVEDVVLVVGELDVEVDGEEDTGVYGLVVVVALLVDPVDAVPVWVEAVCGLLVVEVATGSYGFGEVADTFDVVGVDDTRVPVEEVPPTKEAA